MNQAADSPEAVFVASFTATFLKGIVSIDFGPLKASRPPFDSFVALAPRRPAGSSKLQQRGKGPWPWALGLWFGRQVAKPS